MIYFGIPLRSREASNNWDSVTRVFNRTLESIYRQTNSDFQIFIACHEIPILTHTYDKRVKFLLSNQPVPRNKEEMMLDKGWKVSMIAEQIKKMEGDIQC